MVITFEKCIARPGLKDNKYPLSEHLEAVAKGIGDPNGDPLSRLCFLSGLLHDMGKARTTWQQWIRSVGIGGGKGKSVNHSPLGSAIFVFYGNEILPKFESNTKQLRALKRHLLLLARDIYDHHGGLGDLEEDPPWGNTLMKDDLLECDLKGITNYIKSFFPEGEWHVDEIIPWLEEAPKIWKGLYYDSQRISTQLLRTKNPIYYGAAKICLEKRKITSSLILNDRYHAAGIESHKKEIIEPKSVLGQFWFYCQSKATEMKEKGGKSSDIVQLRQKIQEDCLNNYIGNQNNSIFTLLLPTGLGKTLTGTRVALKALADGRCKKIIYVAPYLSILSQATKEISFSTGLDVFQHNHLAVFDSEEELTERDLLAMDSWEAPIITTTFNQLFRALFPARAQNTLRMEGLKQAFLIIDEPQIIDLSTWNIFLHMLQAATEVYNMQVLFSTATMPSFDFGLSIPVCNLAPQITAPDRYRIKLLPNSVDEEGVVDLALSSLSEKGSIAIIMNTIKDAGEVYQLLKQKLPEKVKCFNMTGCMTPLHKVERIAEIKDSLEGLKRTVVVSTQVLECGVDLSFNAILRALPIIPSIVQAAGRANRHNEGDKAEVIVFKFLRRGKTDTRRYVYKAEEARRVTDNCFQRNSSWDEPQTTEIIAKYYHELMEINIRTSSLELLSKAATGQWSGIAGLDPFKANYPKIDVFVPFGEESLSERARSSLNKVTGGEGPEKLYDLYLDNKYRAKLTYVERKKFMGLIQQFCVSLDPATARTLIAGIEDVAIARIANPADYSKETGLAHCLSAQIEEGNGIYL